MLSDSPGVPTARSGIPHSGVASRGKSQKQASASGRPIASRRPTPRSCPRSGWRPAWPSSCARRCSAISALPPASAASAVVSGPWSSRNAAKGENSAKPSRLRASRRLRSSLDLIASIAASSAQPVSRPGRTTPICQTMAPSMPSTSSRRTGIGNTVRHDRAAVMIAASAITPASSGGSCSSNGNSASAALARVQLRALRSSRAGVSVMRHQRQRAQAQVMMAGALAGPERWMRRQQQGVAAALALGHIHPARQSSDACFMAQRRQ